MKVSIVIPVYNEEKRIEKTLIEYGKYFGKLKKEGVLDYEIVAVLNACKDRSLEIVSRAKRKIKEIRILNFPRNGKGFAVVEGFKPRSTKITPKKNFTKPSIEKLQERPLNI